MLGDHRRGLFAGLVSLRPYRRGYAGRDQRGRHADFVVVPSSFEIGELNLAILMLNARYYQEFNVENRWEGNMTIVSGTIRY